jgi:type II secretory pathway pseudopilin PulG
MVLLGVLAYIALLGIAAAIGLSFERWQLRVEAEVMQTVQLAAERRDYFADADGIATFYKDPDSVGDYTIDWRRVLGDDTIATATWTVTGVTGGTETSNLTSTTIVISGGSGEAKCVVTTAGGRTHVRRLRFIEKET